MNYPIDIVVKYSNDKEYRNCLRKIFSMNTNSTWNDSERNTEPVGRSVYARFGSEERATESDITDLDEVSQDELLYDSDATNNFLDFIYDKTKNNTLLIELYILAASVMISTDTNIGLAVLFSYDYFIYFHKCLCIFFDDNNNNNIETNDFYIYLKNRFSS